ncbi:amino acid adenylation domain-containing protein [Streptomyces sp. CB02414]|uniref:amino acid adenylation domain-containing protein n=1 Tax=Streptomyces sp. CB02414 TaxID=1703922 RepID=UPI00093E1CD6|nr:amino acid adenylation domain-containing protein [Streptomyces sp. CB02414]
MDERVASRADRTDGGGRPVHHAIAYWARRTPQAPAITCADGVLSYRELDERANRLAHHLRGLGVERGVVVAVHLDRGLEHYVALLGVHRAGGAALPLDTGYPEARLRYMLEDSGALVVITRQDAGAGTVVDPYADAALIAACPATPPDVGVRRDDLACLMYTSASTGAPKGVQLEHGGIADLCRWHAEALGLTAADRGSLAAPLSFDASILDLWPLLSVGGHAVAVSDDDRGDPERLVRALRERVITVCFLTTALAEIVLAQPGLETLALRWLVTGGEALRRRPRPGLPFRLMNIYGPTETTVYVTSAVVADEAAADGPVPIGRPLGGVDVRLLDPQGRPVPAGEAGEIVVAGPGVARGYLRRPGLTSRRFGMDGGLRTYRTGDLARLGADGQFEFLGRIDRQVKVRGHRIEPDEIERALMRHPGVRQAAVAAVRPAGQAAQLVAYVEKAGPGGAAGWSVPPGPAGSAVTTVAAVRALAPRSVLEIGPGVPGLDKVCDVHERRESLTSEVRGAYDLVLVDAHAVDGADGLLAVIGAAQRHGGTVLVSGVRSLPLLGPAAGRAVLAAAVDGTTGDELRWRAYGQHRDDAGPAVHPVVFADLPAGSVEIVPRYDRADPGRFDVLVRAGEVPEAPGFEWRDYGGEVDLAAIRAVLRGGEARVFGVRGIPYAELAARFSAWRGMAGQVTAGELRARARPGGAPSPVDLRALTLGLPYRVRLSWAAGRADGALDAVWLHDTVPEPVRLPWPGPAAAPVETVNRAPDEAGDERLREELREVLAARFVPHEMPDLLVLLDRLPLTPVGKVDRSALPLPWWLDGPRRGADGPRSAAEEAVSGLVEELLGRGVGRDDDLRTLGAHSLTFAQLSSRILHEFGVRVPVRRLLEEPSVAAIAGRLGVSGTSLVGHTEVS